MRTVTQHLKEFFTHALKRALMLACIAPGLAQAADFPARAVTIVVPYAAGGGGITHLSGELFKGRAGVGMTHIPYKGAAPALTDLMGGQIDMLFDAVITAYPHIRSGKLKALGMANATRWAGAPEIPTIAESGLPGFEVSGWYGVLAPAATPAAVLERLNTASNEIIRDPDFTAKLQAAGLSPMGGDLENYRRIMRNDFTTWQKVIKDGNITMQ